MATLARSKGSATAGIVEKPINGTFGAVIEGIRLADDHDQRTIDAIREALDRHRVLVFREQHDLDPHSYLRFSRRFGEPETVPHPTHPDYEGAPGVKVLVSDAGVYPKNRESWHTDGAPRANRHWISMLQAIDVPPYGRDTVFADMVSVLDRLSDSLRGYLETLTCTHSWGAQKPEADPVVHPMIVQNKRTGHKALYVNNLYTRHINELRHDESKALLDFLVHQARMPEVQLRVSWEPGTVTMWDNEFTQHYLVLDKDYPRVMHRIMVTDAA